MLAPETTEAPPEYVIPCWVSEACPRLCVDTLAEWMTSNGASPLWLPTCTGCKDRFVRLNPHTLVRRL